MDLIQLGSSLSFSADDLRVSHAAYLAASGTQRREFEEARITTVLRWSGSKLDEHSMRTSGSTGHFKTYKYGPCATALNNFFIDLVAGDTGWTRWIQLVLKRRKSSNDEITCHDQPGDLMWAPAIRLMVVPVGTPRNTIIDAITDGKHTVVQSYPYNLEKLSELIDLSSIDPRDVTFASTGAPLSPSVNAAYQSSGHVVRDYMRCWDGGATFYTCRYGNKHWVDMLSQTRIDQGELVCNDLFNVATPMLSYRNGDVLSTKSTGMCLCGAEASEITFDEMSRWVIHSDNKILSFRLLHEMAVKASKNNINGVSFMFGLRSKRLVAMYEPVRFLDETLFANCLEALVRLNIGNGYTVGVHEGLPESRFKIAKIRTFEDDVPDEGVRWAPGTKFIEI